MTNATSDIPARRAAWLNLLLPGAGLILVGSIATGLLIGLAFAARADLALAAALLFPDDFPPAAQLIAAVLTAAIYLLAQLRLAQTLRDLRRRAATAQRGRVLAEVQELLARGDAARAAELIRPLADQRDDDLLVVYRLAQALTAAGDVPGARVAWLRVRELDPHGIYKQQLREYLVRFESARPT